MADTPDTTDQAQDQASPQAPTLPATGQPDPSWVAPEDRQGMLAHAVDYYAQNGEQFWGPGSMSYTQARVPGLGAAQDIDYYRNLYASAQALQGGGGDKEDIYRVAAHLGKQRYEATRTGIGQRVLDIGSTLPGAVAEWEITGGAAGGAKAAAEEAVGGIAKQYLGNLAGKVATKAAGYAAEGVARSALMPSTYGGIAQQTVGQDEQGNVTPQSLGMATLRGGATAVIQNTINAGAGTFAPKQGGSILRSTAQAVGAGQLTKEALYQLALSGKPSEIHDLLTSENKGEALKALGAEAVAFGGLEGFMHAVPKIAARRAELQKAGVPDNSPQMQQELQKTAKDIQSQAAVDTPKPGRLPGGGIEPIIGPDGKDEFGRPAQAPAPQPPGAPPAAPEAPQAQPPAEAPPAAPAQSGEPYQGFPQKPGVPPAFTEPGPGIRPAEHYEPGGAGHLEPYQAPEEGAPPGARQSWNHAGTKFTDTEGGTEFQANGKRYEITGNLGTSPSDGKPYLDVRANDPETGQEHGRLLLDRKEGDPGSTDYTAAELRVHPSLRGKENADSRRAVVNGLYDFAHEQLGELKGQGDAAGGEIVPSKTQSEGGKAVWARNASLKAGEEGPPPEPSPLIGAPGGARQPIDVAALQQRVLSKGMKEPAEPGASAEGWSRDEWGRMLRRLATEGMSINRAAEAGKGPLGSKEEAAANRGQAMREVDQEIAQRRAALEALNQNHGLITHEPEVSNAIESDARTHGIEPEALRREIAAELQSRAEQTEADAEAEGRGQAAAPHAEPAPAAAVPEAAPGVLSDLAKKAIPREELQRRGFRNLAKSTDLFEHGYSISHWLHPGTKEEVIEYNPRTVAGEATAAGPRMTATNYDEQKAVHEAIGAPVVGPGEDVTPRAPARPDLSQQERMRRGRAIPRQYEAQAREEGVDPEALHAMALDVMTHDREQVRDHNEVTTEAWRSLKEFKVVPATLRANESPDDVRGFDEVAGDMVRKFPDYFPEGTDPDEKLWEMLQAGKRKPAGEESAYRQALQYFLDQKGTNSEAQEARDEGHSPAEIAKALREGVQDGQADAKDAGESPHPPGDAADVGLGAGDFDFGANVPEPAAGPEPAAAGPSGAPGGTSGPAGPGDRISAALARYDNRDITARGGGLFGGEDLQTREGFGKLPNGAPVVFTEGEMRGQTGTIGRDEQGNIGVAMEGRPGLANVDPAAIEPLNPWQSWRTTATTAPVQQGGLFSAESFLGPRKEEGIPEGGAFHRFMTSEDASLPLEKYEEVYKGIADFFRKLNGAKAPRTARLSPAAADAIAHYDNAGDRARLTAPLMLDKVLGKNAPDVMDELVGAVRTERALRYTHTAFMQESAKASQAAAQLRTQAAADKAAGYRQHPADVWQEMIKSQADRATEMMRSAKDVTSIIGQPAIPDQGIPESPLKSYADYQKALANPEVQKALGAFKANMVPVMEDNFRRAQGMDVTDPINSLTQIPGDPTNLKPVSLEAPGVGGRGNLGNLKLGKFKFSKQRAGNADAYDFRLSSIIDNSLNHGFANAAKAEMFRTIEAEGLGTWAKPGQGPEGTQAIPFVAPPAGTQEAQAGETTFYVHPQVAGELRQVLGVDMPTPKLPGTGLLNAVAVASLVEPVTHIKNQLSMFTRPGMSPADFVGHALSVMAKDGGIMGRIAELAGLDVQGRQERLAQLAGIGAVSEQGQMGRLLPQSLGRYDPTAWLGKAIETSDLAMRLTADDAYTRLTKTNSILTGKPLAEDTETGRRDFINQLGNYSKRTQSKLVAFLRDVGLGPFATAGANFNVMGMKDVLMDPGVKATSTGAAVELRMRMLGRTLAALSVVPAINYMLWKRVDGDDKTPYGSIKVGTGEGGATRYVPVANWLGLDRGAKLLGLDAMAEGARAKRPIAHSADKAVQDAVEQWTHPAIGPSAQAAYTAYTGKNTLGMQIAPKAKPQGSQEWQNFLAAVKNWNPVVAAATGANRPASQQRKPLTAATVAEGLAGPFVRERKTPPGKDISMMRR